MNFLAHFNPSGTIPIQDERMDMEFANERDRLKKEAFTRSKGPVVAGDWWLFGREIDMEYIWIHGELLFLHDSALFLRNEEASCVFIPVANSRTVEFLNSVGHRLKMLSSWIFPYPR